MPGDYVYHVVCVPAPTDRYQAPSILPCTKATAVRRMCELVLVCDLDNDGDIRRNEGVLALIAAGKFADAMKLYNEIPGGARMSLHADQPDFIGPPWTPESLRAQARKELDEYYEFLASNGD